jgi:hypothetical protein
VKNLKRIGWVGILAIALLLSPAICRAGNITSVSISGPGGTGQLQIRTNNTSAADGSMIFTSVNEINIVVQVNGPGFYNVDFANGVPAAFGITNDTGVTWTSFLFEGSAINGGGSVAPFLGFIEGTAGFAWLTGSEPVGVGEILQSGFDFITSGSGTFSFFALPNAPVPSFVPEPNSLTMLVVGLVFVVLFRLAPRAFAQAFNRCSTRWLSSV